MWDGVVVPESVVPRTTVVIRQPASTSSSEGEKLDTQVQEKSPQVGMKKRWADVVRA